MGDKEFGNGDVVRFASPSLTDAGFRFGDKAFLVGERGFGVGEITFCVGKVGV